MNEKYFLGIDGGGSGLRVAIVDCRNAGYLLCRGICRESKCHRAR